MVFCTRILEADTRLVARSVADSSPGAGRRRPARATPSGRPTRRRASSTRSLVVPQNPCREGKKKTTGRKTEKSGVVFQPPKMDGQDCFLGRGSGFGARKTAPVFFTGVTGGPRFPRRLAQKNGAGGQLQHSRGFASACLLRWPHLPFGNTLC